MLKVMNLESGYHGLAVLHGVSLHVAPGEIVTLIGANGSGKSTLLLTLAGLIPATAGSAYLDSVEITNRQSDDMVRRGLALVPEGRQLFAPLTVCDNLVLGSYRAGGRRRGTLDEDLQRMYEMFPILWERRRQAAGTLSGGEQQMLAIARGLMSHPDVLLLDEPSLGLAPRVAWDIFKTLEKLREAGTSVLLVEQNARLALKTADRGYVIETGQIVLDGTNEDLLNNEEVCRAYLGSGYRDVWE